MQKLFCLSSCHETGKLPEQKKANGSFFTQMILHWNELWNRAFITFMLLFLYLHSDAQPDVFCSGIKAETSVQRICVQPSKCLFPSRSCRGRPPDAKHLQRPEGDHQPRRHGSGCHPQLLTSLSAVHPAIHAGRHPAARRERESPHRPEGLPQVRQNHADYIWWWALGDFPTTSKCLCPSRSYLWPPPSPIWGNGCGTYLTELDWTQVFNFHHPSI